jgi:antitoxin StbD
MHPYARYMTVCSSQGTTTVSDARQHLTGHVARFRREGVLAEPVVFGDRRRPEAVLLPYETFELLLDVAEDIVIAERIRARDASDDRGRITLAEAAAEFGIDLDTL